MRFSSVHCRNVLMLINQANPHFFRKILLIDDSRECIASKAAHGAAFPGNDVKSNSSDKDGEDSRAQKGPLT